MEKDSCSNFVDLFDQISKVANLNELHLIALEVQSSILEKKITEEKDIIILTLSIQVQTLSFKLQESQTEQDPTIYYIIMDNDGDHETSQIQEFYEKELEEFRNGTVISMERLVKASKI